MPSGNRIKVSTTIVGPTVTEEVEGLRLPTELLRDYMNNKVRNGKAGEPFWSGVRAQLGLDRNRKYKIRIIGLVLEKA